MLSADGTDSAYEARVRCLLQVVANREDYKVALELLADDVAVLVDKRQLSASQDAWLGWVRYLHYSAAMRITDLDINIESISTSAAPEAASKKAGRDLRRVAVDASWHGKNKHTGESLTAAMGEVEYDLDEDTIRTIHTHRYNYTFIYGNSVMYAPVFYFWVTRMLIWRARNPYLG